MVLEDQATMAQAKGGTLRFLGPGDPNHLDTTSAYYLRTNQLQRVLARQLFAYPASMDVSDPAQAFLPMPDVASEIPTEQNGGLSEDRLVYTIRLRTNVRWNTKPPREVTAQDFIRGLKHIANPMVGSGVQHYFTSTIVGMQEYRDAYAKAYQGSQPTVGDFARFHDSQSVAGLRAHDDKTLVITLSQPANDFLNILAMGIASALPREYDDCLLHRLEFRQNLISNGPYQIGKYGADVEEMVLERNTVWRQETDPIRRQTVDAIHIGASRNGAEVVRQMIDSGQIDLAWPFTVVSWRKSQAEQIDFPRSYPGFTLNPYLVFNLQSPNERGAMRNLKVREAIAYAIDKVAISKIMNVLEGVVTAPLHSVIPPGSVGHSEFNLYPTPGNGGNTTKARELLAESGYMDGLTLIAAVRDVGLHLEIMRSVATNLAKCGINLVLRTYTQSEYYGALLSDPINAKTGSWDIAEAGWTPDWFGNNGRAIIRPLFYTDGNVRTTNYGCYSNSKVDCLIEKALQQGEMDCAEQLWRQLDIEVMKDLPIVPILAFACQSCAARQGIVGWGVWSPSPLPSVEETN